VCIYSRSTAKVEQLIRDFAARPDWNIPIVAALSPTKAVRDADIICAATTSRESVFRDDDLKPGVHINAVGSYTPAAREVPPETVVRAKVVVDSREAAWEEAGDLIQPCEAGLIGRDHIHAELGEIVLRRKPARTDDREITFFKSVGIAIQDAAASRVAMQNARRLGLGARVAW
jgi:ornithine cyclodeaminase/alanine dehydrogenase-like protein (mu-crystallin family)